MKRLFFFCLFPAFLSASPFTGFYLGGGLGWEEFRLVNRSRDVLVVGFETIENKGSGSGLVGEGFVGWNGSFGLPHIGARIGYQGFSKTSASYVFFGVTEVWKLQGAFLDLTPGWQVCPSLLIHGIFGAGYTKYRYFGMNQFRSLFRDQTNWSFLPRLGLGLQWAFWRCLTAGFEWIYKLPGRPVWYGPSRGPQLTDQNIRQEKLRGNHFAFTLNWYFYR